MVRSVASLAFIAFLTFTSSQPASAHERREVGKYTLVVGWNSEPALEGDQRYLAARLRDHFEQGRRGPRAGGPRFGDLRRLREDLRARPPRGTRHTRFIHRGHRPDPRRRLHLPLPGQGRGREIDERFESGPQRFDSIKSQEDLQFPDRVGSSSELARQIRGAIDYAETTRTFFIGALALSAMAALLAAAALVQVRRRR